MHELFGIDCGIPFFCENSATVWHVISFFLEISTKSRSHQG